MVSNLFPPLGRKIRVRFLGREFDVPASATILRALQFLFPWEISLGDFCWNNECGNCEVIFKNGSEPTLRRTRCCQYLMSDRMQIVEISKELDRCIGSKLREAKDHAVSSLD